MAVSGWGVCLGGGDACLGGVSPGGVHPDVDRMTDACEKFFSNGTAKTKLAILAFLCCGDFMKNPIT